MFIKQEVAVQKGGRIRQVIRRLSLSLALVLTVGVTGGEAQTEVRRFAFTYETTTVPVEQWEYEQGVLFEYDKKDNASFDLFVFRHRLKYGLAENWQLSAFLSDWSYGNSRQTGSNLEWIGAGGESLYRFSDPEHDWLGTGLALAVLGGNRFVEAEGRLILQKDIDGFATAYNAIVRGQWEGEDLTDRWGVVEQTLGAGYQVHPKAFLGVEMLHRITYADWSERGDTLFYFGPLAALHDGPFWLSFAPLFQLTDVRDEVSYLVQFLAGWQF